MNSTTNHRPRHNSYDRRRRKQKLLARWGNRVTCNCVHCGKVLTFETLTSDRIEAGGTYALENVQPSCLECNIKRGDRTDWPGDRVWLNSQEKAAA